MSSGEKGFALSTAFAGTRYCVPFEQAVTDEIVLLEPDPSSRTCAHSNPFRASASEAQPGKSSHLPMGIDFAPIGKLPLGRNELASYWRQRSMG